MKNEAILREAIRTFGVDHQIRMMLEEMAELQKELLKYMRAYSLEEKEEIRYRIIGEIIDVKIMINQMQLIFNESNDYPEIYDEKIKRLIDYIEYENNINSEL